MPVEVLISIVKDWYEWLVSGLVHLLSNDPFRRMGLHVMPCNNHRPSFLFQNPIIPIQLICRACFNAHIKYHTLNSCERFGHASLHTNPLIIAFKCPKIDKKVINSYTKCLISVKIAILTPHITPPPLLCGL